MRSAPTAAAAIACRIPVKGTASGVFAGAASGEDREDATDAAFPAADASAPVVASPAPKRRAASSTSGTQTRPNRPVARQSLRLIPSSPASRRATGVASTPESSAVESSGVPDRVAPGFAGTDPPAAVTASSTSARLTRPPRPEPVTAARSMPWSQAKARAWGVAKTSSAVVPRSDSGTTTSVADTADGAAAAGVGAGAAAREGSGAGAAGAASAFGAAASPASPASPAPGDRSAMKASISASGTDGSAETPMRAPTGRTSPVWATMRRSTPSKPAARSFMTLVDSIATSRSPSAKESPSARCHSSTVPSDMVMPHLGISMALMVLISHLHDLAHGVLDTACARNPGLLQRGEEGHRGMRRHDQLDRGPQ